MSWFTEFKKFALRGSMIDLAIGFTVGAAFTSVVTSLVNDVIMPPIGLLTGGADFSDHFMILDVPDGVQIPESGFTTLEAATSAGAVTLNYGRFFNNCLSLLIVALAMYLIIRSMNRLEEQLEDVLGEERPPPEEPTDKKCEYCRTTIPYRATRCPNCTSPLTSPTTAAGTASTS